MYKLIEVVQFPYTIYLRYDEVHKKISSKKYKKIIKINLHSHEKKQSVQNYVMFMYMNAADVSGMHAC